MVVRGDIRALPFRKRCRFRLVMAPYGMLQSLVRDADLTATLRAATAVLPRGAMLGVDLVPDLPRWDEYRRHVSLQGRMSGGRHVTLFESVRQDRERRLTIFDQEFVERRGHMRTAHRFSLVFRTLSVRQMRGRLRRAGFTIETVLGDYTGGEWHREAETWIVLARKG